MIETGVDKLISLIKKEGRLALDDVAKRLKVSPKLVLEWADILEEEGVVSIEYKLSKTYIVPKKFSKKEIENKEKEYKTKKEAFISKADSLLNAIQTEALGLKELKKQYLELKEIIGDEIHAIEDQFKELEHYETIKKTLDRDIIQQKIDLNNFIADIDRKLKRQEERCRDILEAAKEEERYIERTTEKIKKTDGRIESERELHLERLQMLKDFIEEVRRGVYETENRLEPLIKAAKEHEERIKSIQNDLILKVKERNKEIKSYSSKEAIIEKKLQDFFAKKNRIEEIIHKLEKERHQLLLDIENFKSKIRTFNLAVSETDVKKHLKELEEKTKELENEKVNFEKDIASLREEIYSKNKKR